ncbi:MAG: MlaD family protein [Prevotellaceae bacterium]|jgi:phospholipid/cholesterol/gamma-HCH transport system substrate-binding protein|nr:MlaD family protein [Prevotellaceae bacterium]
MKPFTIKTDPKDRQYMAKISKELKIGIYFIVTIIALYWGINFLKGKDIFGKVNTFYAIYDNVEGLQATSNIFVKGLKVGTVESITFLEETQKFTVKMRIQSKYNIPKNSVAHLYSADIMGNKAIKIEVSNDSIYLPDKSKIVSAIDSDLTTTIVKEIMPLKNKAEHLVDELNKTFISINNVLDTNAVANLNKSIAYLSSTLQNFEKLSKSLANDNDKISGILANVESITSNLKDNNAKINNIFHNFSTLSDSLANIKLANTINDLQNIIAQINSGNGTLGKLVRNDSLYVNLVNSLNSVDLLLKDLRKNPKRYVNLSIFGSN